MKLVEISKQEEFRLKLKNPLRAKIMNTIEHMKELFLELSYRPDRWEYQFNEEHDIHKITFRYNRNEIGPREIKELLERFFPRDGELETSVHHKTLTVDNDIATITLYIMERPWNA